MERKNLDRMDRMTEILSNRIPFILAFLSKFLHFPRLVRCRTGFILDRNRPNSYRINPHHGLETMDFGQNRSSDEMEAVE